MKDNSPLKLLQKLFKELRSIYLRYIEFVEPEAYDFFPCWVIGTYIFNEFESFPYVYLLAPKRSGKSKTLLLTSKLAKNKIFAVNISQASVYRVIEDRDPTLFIDEADYLSSEEKAELYKILNSGYKKGAGVFRCEPSGKKMIIKEWNVYCPKMLASVRELKEQFVDRCITFKLMRSRNKEVSNNVVREKVDDKGVEWKIYRNGLEEYVIKMKDEILKNFEEIDTDIRMEEIIGRDRELWLPILAIAKTLGSEHYAKVINLALQRVAETREQEKESVEHIVLETLGSMVKEKDWILVKDIYKELKMKPEWEWINIRTVGKVLKRLGFKFRHSSHGAMYYISRDEIEDKARRYGAVLNDVSDDSDESDVKTDKDISDESDVMTSVTLI